MAFSLGDFAEPGDRYTNFASGERETLSEDGFVLDDWGQEWGYCNSCGEEARAEETCCDDGEVVPHD